MRFNNDLLQQSDEQQRIRRGPHEWKQTGPDGQNGVYVPTKYKHQEYPKMMGTFPKPQHKQFLKSNGVDVPADLALARYEAALREWDAQMQESIVTSAAEEAEWKRQNR